MPTITVSWFGDNYEESAVRDYGDSVVFDFRGIGSQPPLTCPEMSAAQREILALTSLDATARQLNETAAAQCGQRLTAAGIDLNQYGVLEIALDIRDLAIAKGWRQINLQSTGDYSRIAILLARLYPGLVRSVVIVDPVPLGAAANTQIPNLNAAIDGYVAACEADAGCSARYPDLKQTITSQFEDLQQHPRLISTKDPLRDGNVNIMLDGDRLIYSLLVALNTQSALGLAASTLYASEESRLAATASFFAENAQLHPDLPWGQWNSMQCEDTQPEVSRSSIVAADATYPMFRGFARAALDGFDFCSVWPTMADSAFAVEQKVVPVPALILAGELSPFFPRSYAEAAADNFSDPTIGVFPNLTGLPLRDGPGCVRDLRLAFLRDPESELDLEGCKGAAPPIKFEGAS